MSACARFAMRALGVLAIGCSGANVAPLPATESPPPRAGRASSPQAAAPAAPVAVSAPGCTLAWRDGSVWLAARELSLVLPDGTEGIATYALDATHIAVAGRSTWSYGPESFRSDGRLWRVDCTSGELDTLANEPGADFGHAVLLQHQLYFSSARGVGRLDLDRGAIERVLAPAPAEPLCSEAETLVDLVVSVESLEPTTLRIQRGNFCADHGDWISHEMLLDLATGVLRRESPISALAADAQGTLWLGAAGRCDVPGPIDRQADGRVFRSRDAGATWQAVEVPGLRVAARDVLVDRRQAGRLLVVGNACSVGEVERCVGCSVHSSSDDGGHWRTLRLPVPAERIVDVRVSAPDGELSRLELLVSTTEHASLRFASRDGGRRWDAVAGEAATQPDRSGAGQVTVASGAVLRPSRDGVVSEQAGERRVIFRVPD